MPPKGSFVLDIDTVEVYPFDTQTIGGGSFEWVTLEDVTNGGTVPKMRVKGTVPDGFDGAVSFTVNGVYDGITYTFPLDSAPFVITVESIVPENVFELVDDMLGLGFFNKRRLRMHADRIEYVAGGLPVPNEFKATGLVNVSAKGGYMGYLDVENQRIMFLTKAGTEASGALEDVSVILIGE